MRTYLVILPFSQQSRYADIDKMKMQPADFPKRPTWFYALFSPVFIKCAEDPLKETSPGFLKWQAIEGAVQRLRPKLMTVCAVLASIVPILWESGIGSDAIKPTAAPIVGGMITSAVHVLILAPVFLVMMKERALRNGTLQSVAQTVLKALSETQPQLL